MMTLRLLLTIIIVLAFAMVQAQEFKKFLVAVGVGVPQPNEGDGIAMIYGEPMFRISDRWSVGGRFEVGTFGRHPSSGGFIIRSYAMNTRFYFTGTSFFRPFVEVGGVLYALDKANAVVGSSVVIDREVFGFYPQLGVDVGHFFLSVAYNYIPEQKAKVLPVGSDFSYVGLCIGGTIGGGRK